MDLLEIGTVRHDLDDDQVRDMAGSIDGIIEIYPDFTDGILSLERYPYIFVLAVMHKHLDEKYPLRIKPRLLLRKGYKLEDLPEIGVFASDSPSRPNPIGLSLLRVRSIEENSIHVSGLDMFNGTPVVDIKPYMKKYSVREESPLGKYSLDECADPGRH